MRRLLGFVLLTYDGRLIIPPKLPEAWEATAADRESLRVAP